MIRKKTSGLLVILCSLSFVGCAGAMRHYDGEMKGAIGNLGTGKVDESLKVLESNNTSDGKDLLYFLEKGELLTLNKSYVESLDARLSADEKVRNWEDEVKLTPEKLLGNIGSVIVNDKTRRYDGRDYEKVFLTSRLALNHLFLGEWDKARTEVKKMHEREAIIAEYRAKEIIDAEEKANSKGIKTNYQDLKGYPVETLDDPDVTNLKNGYQNAYAHYLSGFIYESLGENSLAAAGYRQAIELKPGMPFLEDGLKELDVRYKKNRRENVTDVLFVIESGSSPSFNSMSIPVPLPLGGKLGITPISFPVIKPDSDSLKPETLTLENKGTPLALITNVNVMARRALKDEMPGIILRSSVRAITKAVAQKVANEKDSSGVSGLLLMIGGLVMEGADERSWRTLPSNVSVARLSLPHGTHQFTIKTPLGDRTGSVDISGQSVVVDVRLIGDSIYIAQSAPVPEALLPAASSYIEERKNDKVVKLEAESQVVKSSKKKGNKSKSASKVK